MAETTKPAPREPVLLQADRVSPAWIKVRAYLEGRLLTLRIANDAAMSEDKRNRHGGRIDEIKALLALDSDPPLVQDENDKFPD